MKKIILYITLLPMALFGQSISYISQDTTWDGSHDMSGKVVVQDGATLLSLLAPL